MILLSVVFITCIPNMLKAGNITGTIKNAFSEVVNLIFSKERLKFLLTLYPIIANVMNVILSEINSGIVDKGVK